MRSLACVWIPAVLVASACTPAAYAPPSRPIALDSPTAPRAGGTDVQGEVGRIGAFWGPDLVDGNLRVRHAVSDLVVVEGEAGMAYVDNDGSVGVPSSTAARTTTTPGTPVLQGGSRDAYTGRGGVVLQGGHGPVRGALTAGLGGGYSPTAGGWTSVDVGASAGGTNHWLRPWAAVDLGLNTPWSHRVFVVDYGDQSSTLALTRDAIVRVTCGLELGPVGRALVLGLSVTQVIASDDGVLGDQADAGDDGYVGVAIGFRARL